MAMCPVFHAVYALQSLQQIGYRDLLSYAPGELLLLVLASVVRSLVHELGHAAACWRLTRSVGAIGYGVFITTPVLYCDVSDIHLLPRKAQAFVGLAGIAMDIVFSRCWPASPTVTDLMPTAPGVVLGVITALQYAALVFGLLTGAKAAWRAAFKLKRRYSPPSRHCSR